jgi:redox-sensitive bicupin YhaK (pirin superfamily)
MLTAHMTRIAPHNGFTWHPHRGLEICTWVLEGTLHHEDTPGGQATSARVSFSACSPANGSSIKN